MNNTVRDQLIALADPVYRDFSLKLTPGVTNLLGVRLPHLRRLAKELVRQDAPVSIEAALKHCSDTGAVFEEIMLTGMMIGYARADWPQTAAWIQAFVPHIRNWSVCDSFCVSLKIARRHPDALWELITPYLTSEDEYAVRFAAVMMLMHYLDDEHIDRVLELLYNNRHPAYMAQMAVGWAFSAAYARYPEKTRVYLERTDGVPATRRIALQKIMESRRTTDAEREVIRRLKQR